MAEAAREIIVQHPFTVGASLLAIGPKPPVHLRETTPQVDRLQPGAKSIERARFSKPISSVSTPPLQYRQY
ncbi:hypothetical protein PS662_03748 [Pseudomonas fluorescens]|uniref:Uncharacterized protein n=1 Tax=Pseudomonas fluorescens TaxID=294 RepID=A0A5E6V8N2_PSEFL|nr:hypothetical protein PS662_03748 [Pseudomonas fluorescens]